VNAAYVSGAGQVPVQLSSFIGRENERQQVVELLRSSRLLTLTGAGGVGKTRLALAVLQDSRVYKHANVYFADLAPLGDPELVPQSIAVQLGIPEQPGRAVVATLIDALESDSGLLVLDNCEHLVDACARLIAALLSNCPSLHVMTTSREPLLIAGEKVLRVPSLELPEAPFDREKVARAEAVHLFVERAQAVNSAFQLNEQNAAAVAEVCCRLDGIPLALELAAARCSMLSVDQLAGRLDDA
jgi:non-specific serine/threonine protein kinase